jgi:hypothetical protein
MRRESVITGLICLNLGLLAGLAYVWKQRLPAKTALPTAGNQEATTSTTGTRFVTRKIQSAGGAPATPGRFTWRLLESADFKRYIENLRSVGCPEQTIQDIIVAEVNKLYAGKEAALRLRPEHLKPWEMFGASRFAEMDRERKFRQLMREKRALLKDLLGIDVPQEVPSIWARSSDSAQEAALAKLPEGKRELVREIQDQLWDKQQELQARTMGFWEPEDQQEMQRLQKEYRDALAKTLAPDELLDYQLATSPTARNLRSELSAFSASDQEFRDIFRLRQQVEDATMDLQGNDPEANRKRMEAHQQMDQQLRTMLGEQRYAEYQRSRDYQYRNLTRLARDNGLPPDTASKAYDMNQLAMQEAARIRSQRDLSREERDALLRQMQADLDSSMGNLLGPQVYQRFQQNYGGARVYVEPRLSRTVVRPEPVTVPNTVITVP